MVAAKYPRGEVRAFASNVRPLCQHQRSTHPFQGRCIHGLDSILMCFGVAWYSSQYYHLCWSGLFQWSVRSLEKSFSLFLLPGLPCWRPTMRSGHPPLMADLLGCAPFCVHRGCLSASGLPSRVCSLMSKPNIPVNPDALKRTLLSSHLRIGQPIRRR